STESFAAAYGTTYYFNPDGTPSCSIRGKGPQQFTFRTDEAHEIYPTCFSYSFVNNQKVVTTSNPSELLVGSPQFTVRDTTVHTAIGRVVERSKGSPIPGTGSLSERASFSYDALGHPISVTRFKNPGTSSGGVTTRWHYDSLGWMTKLEEP